MVLLVDMSASKIGRLQARKARNPTGLLHVALHEQQLSGAGIYTELHKCFLLLQISLLNTALSHAPACSKQHGFCVAHLFLWRACWYRFKRAGFCVD
jgi:hypothetical protein